MTGLTQLYGEGLLFILGGQQTHYVNHNVRAKYAPNFISPSQQNNITQLSKVNEISPMMVATMAPYGKPDVDLGSPNNYLGISQTGSLSQREQ